MSFKSFVDGEVKKEPIAHGKKGSFLSYLEEQEDKKNLTVLVCSTKHKGNESHFYPTTEKIVKECEKKGIKYHVIFPDDHYIDVAKSGGSKVTFKNYENDKEIDVDVKNTVVIIRWPLHKNPNSQNITYFLEQKGMFVFNSTKSMEITCNKYQTYLALVQNKIPTPRTFLVNKEAAIPAALKAIGGKFPVVIKTLSGAQGVGVSIIDSEISLTGVLQTLWKFTDEILIQEYMPIDGDIRAIVMDGKVIAAMKRNKMEKDFRSNASLGATTDQIELSKEEEELAIKTAIALDSFYCGIDIFNIKGKLYVVEVNDSPGSEGIIKTSKVNVIGKLIDYVVDKKNWPSTKNKTSGYVEHVSILSDGKEVFEGNAKLDTGAGVASSIHATDINKLDNNMVEFKLKGKKITKKIVRNTEVVKHQGRFTEKRIIVLFDICIGDKCVSDVEFGLTNRSGTIKELEPVLLNREIINKFGFLIDPAHTHLTRS